MTVRETARVMTFPDTWDLKGPRGEKMRQLGNAVPVARRPGRGGGAPEVTGHASKAQSGWKHDSPPDRAWKGRPGRTRAAIAAEQDRAVGGRHRRSVDLGEGRFARASVELKVLPDTRRIRAYLR
ncbi:DNA cytosine methyltransferase [Streptomyces scopuliridis]